jgi:DNA repair exonuclease SbcCD ATPase subunit
MQAEFAEIKERVENRRRLAKVIEHESETIDGAFHRIQPLDDSVKQALNRALDGTLVRFQFDQDFLPVRVRDESREKREGYELHTRDERDSFVLSTGQRGQVALAYMLAQAILLGGQLPHRILVLDDTSTAFDLGNIVRQATWLRQLAYNPVPELRWQIFVASHHEELTNRLIELLVPPEGAELRLIRFMGWSRETGPLIEAHRARRNPPCSEERVRTAFQSRLREAWSDSPFRRVSNG